MKLLPLLAAALLCGCTSIEPVEGAQEVQTKNPDNCARVTTLPDGSRFVVISRGETVETTIHLPPLPVAKVEQ